MLFKPATAAVVVLAASAQLVAAGIPACLLGVINTAQTPGDLGTVCGDANYQSLISQKCGDKASDALKAFKDACSTSNKQVAQAGSATTSGSNAGTTLATTTKSGAATPGSTGTNNGANGGSNTAAAAAGTTTTSKSGALPTGGLGGASYAALMLGAGLVIAL